MSEAAIFDSDKYIRPVLDSVMRLIRTAALEEAVMTNDAIIEAAARAMCRAYGSAGCVMDANPDCEPCTPENCSMMRQAPALLAAVAPLIRAAALEEAAKVAEDYEEEFLLRGDGDNIAARIRTLKEQP